MCSVTYYLVIVCACVTSSVSGQCSIHDLPDKQFLNLQSCELRTLPKDTFQQIHSLKRLLLSNNSIERLQAGTFVNNLKLTYMNFGYNKLRDLDSGVFANLWAVSNLNLTHNELESIEAELFKDMTSLQWLNLSGNRIKYLSVSTFQSNTKLDGLYLNWNQLEDLPNGIFDNLNLLYLHFEHNLLTGIDKELLYNSSILQEFHVSNNFIRTIQTDTIIKKRYLREIYLHQNRISLIEPGAFNNLDRCRILTLYGNRLLYLEHSVADNLKSVPSLLLYDNPWFCDCRLKPLHDIWRPQSEVMSEPRCAGPDKFINRSWTAISNADLCFITVKATVGESVAFKCELSGNTVQWFRGKNVIRPVSEGASGQPYAITTDRTALTIADVRIEDNGWYSCQTADKSEESKFQLITRMVKTVNAWQIFGYVSPVLLVILVVALVVLLAKRYKSRYVHTMSTNADEVPLGNMPQSAEQPYIPLYEEIEERRRDPDEDGYMVANELYH